VPLYGTVEIGGTKTDMAIGSEPDDLSQPERVATSSPQQTLDAVIRFFEHHRVDAVGVASFGPLDLARDSSRFGTMLSTPKAGWSGTPIHDRLKKLGVPVAIDTDVNGAALGEGRWGAATGMTDYAYVTVGTGIGAGIVVDGNVIGGDRHPEAGHVVVRRRPGDDYQGGCPYHGDCLEGLASGPALEHRFGRPETWAGNDAVLDLATHYLAQGLSDLVYIAAPERIIIGGGVAILPGFHDRVREHLESMLSDYPHEPDLGLLISKPGLARSGLAGGLVLAAGA
jgi:fructokinase